MDIDSPATHRDPSPVKQIVQRAASDWLSLRRSADEAAREPSLATVAVLDRHLAEQLTNGEAVNILDLGAGTGANMAWLAPALTVPQRWTLVDRDEELLDEVPDNAALTNVVGLRRLMADLGELEVLLTETNPALVTCSAVLDVLTRKQVLSLAKLLSTQRCAVGFSLSVTGVVRLSPQDALDSEVEGAFNQHQRRSGLAGPDATSLAADVLTSSGFDVTVVDTPWMLGPGCEPLMRRYLTDRATSAKEYQPELDVAAQVWLATRLTQLAHGTLSVKVGHQDLFAIPHQSTP